MVTTIHFPPATLSRLKAEAAKSGKDIDTIVTEAVEARIALSQASLEDVMRPIHKAIAGGGLSSAENVHVPRAPVRSDYALVDPKARKVYQVFDWRHMGPIFVTPIKGATQVLVLPRVEYPDSR